MNTFAMAWRYLRFRWLVTMLTVAGIALGAALVGTVLALRHESERALATDAGLYDLVAGGKGSPLQLVLSSVYHLDAPPGNIPYAEYEQVQRDPRVLWSAPIGLGDNYAGYRIVGTEAQFFELPDRDGNPFFEVAEGRVFEDTFEVVLGSHVAAKTGLGVGDAFAGTHGLVPVPGAEVHTEFPYTVSGILEPTGSAQDRAIFGTLQSVWDVHEAEDQLHDAIKGLASMGGQTERETSAILIRLKTPGLRLWLADDFRSRSDGIAAIPINEILRFQRGVIGPVQRALLGIAGAVVIVACLTVLATLHQAAERRRRDIAILRSLGAVRREVAALVFAEGVLLTVGGLALGLLIGHGGMAIAAPAIRDATGLIIDPWRIPRVEWIAIGTMAVCGAVASLIPAISCYRHTPIDDLQLTD